MGAEGRCDIGVAERGARGESEVGAAIGWDDGKTTEGEAGTKEGCDIGATEGDAVGDTHTGGDTA